MSRSSWRFLCIPGVVWLGACMTEAKPTAPLPHEATRTMNGASPTRSYIVVARSDGTLPDGLSESITALGGTVVSTIPQIGLAVVESDRVGFQEDASRLGDVEGIVPDLPIATDGAESGEAFGSTAETVVAALADPPMPAGGDPLSPLQWALSAIHAPEAWALGYKGHGARVAVLDAGIQSTHPDLVANLNKTLSKSFVAGELYDNPPGPHGTQVSGIIAAAKNGIGVVGVAPEAEIVAIKVLSARTGGGTAAAIIAGIVYAADIGADVVNMSFGGNNPRRTHDVIDTRGTTDPSDDIVVRVSAAEMEQLFRAYGRAANYAHGKGVTLIAASGNLSKDFGHSADDIGIPQELPHVITVGPTGPLGWALDFSTSLDVSPSYTNIGTSYISLAAPGGNFDVFTRPGLPPSCTVLGFVRPCQVFDLVYTTNVGSTYFWNFGGSFAAPHAAGVAALIVSRHGAKMDPDRVEAVLRNTSDDIGKPGNDALFGQGRINALRAVQR